MVTEGVLTRRLQKDPSLDGVGLVILDEYHERSLEADLALALVLKYSPFPASVCGEVCPNLCMDACTSAGDCRAGYTCRPVRGQDICWPGETCSPPGATCLPAGKFLRRHR